MVTPSSPKRFSQSQLTKIFAATADVSTLDLPTLRLRLWFNPTDANSLRLSLEGYRFVIQNCKITSYEFKLAKPLTNKNLLQLERYFQGMYYLLGSTKIIVFDEQEATFLTLNDANLHSYLENLERSS